jgi:hypothetical protein
MLQVGDALQGCRRNRPVHRRLDQSGCPIADHVGRDDVTPGGDNWIIEIGP